MAVLTTRLPAPLSANVCAVVLAVLAAAGLACTLSSRSRAVVKARSAG